MQASLQILCPQRIQVLGHVRGDSGPAPLVRVAVGEELTQQPADIAAGDRVAWWRRLWSAQEDPESRQLKAQADIVALLVAPLLSQDVTVALQPLILVPQPRDLRA